MAEEHNIPKVYDPASVEKKWYKYWEEHRYFHAEVEADKKPFSIVIPLSLIHISEPTRRS